jgi:RNA polymerase sigma-70 factor (ECF subfamily)
MSAGHGNHDSAPQAAASAAELGAYRSYLVRYAQLHLRDRAAAEDAAQETLLAALEAARGFAGKSSVKTWLTGILRHKIVDSLRRRARDASLAAAEAASEAQEERALAELFEPDGHWRNRPADWGDPQRALEDRQFWEVFERCAAGLSERAARVLMLREVAGLSTEEICKELGITPTNCWVTLHRARVLMRQCLETRWFGKAPR